MENKVFIGKIIILENPYVKGIKLRFNFCEDFYSAYNNSYEFINKFSRKIISNNLSKIKFKNKNYFSDIKNSINFSENKSMYKIVPLNIDIQTIENYIFSYLKIVSLDKRNKSSELNNKNLIIYKENAITKIKN